MEQEITHLIVIRPGSPLIPMFIDHGARPKGGPEGLALFCSALKFGESGFLWLTHCCDLHPPPLDFSLPLSEILLISVVPGSDPKTIGFLRGE